MESKVYMKDGIYYSEDPSTKGKVIECDGECFYVARDRSDLARLIDKKWDKRFRVDNMGFIIYGRYITTDHIITSFITNMDDICDYPFNQDTSTWDTSNCN